RQQLRLAAGLTQTEVAEAIGVKRLAVAQWEAGPRPRRFRPGHGRHPHLRS
ncbi:helix-turn-helix transcriptional regulator, partial [Streptomyces sp. NPDC007095]|uniref:helix-turn-helix transcriptional regulator n=1 Tax=Streptomyces sp. NPDC007095 TaxID=3154482 RepID=UPI0033D90F5B